MELVGLFCFRTLARIGGSNLISTLTFMRNVRSFRTLSRIFWGLTFDGIIEIKRNPFPYPREDFLGANQDTLDSLDRLYKFPSPRED